MEHIKFQICQDWREKKFTSEDAMLKQNETAEREISSIQESLNCINEWKLCI